MPISLPLIACFALALALLAIPSLRERALPGRSWMLLRALFPSWRFFEELGQVPKLSYRLLNEDDSTGPWCDCLGHEPRKWGAFFLNARGNLRMAENSLIEQLMTDLAETPDESEIANSVSYELTTRLVRFRINELGAAAPGARFQFRILAAVPGQGEHEGEEAMVSSVHEV